MTKKGIETYNIKRGVIVNPVQQEMSPAEAITHAEALAVTAAAKPMTDWTRAMVRSDRKLPRWGEDILDGMPNKLSVAKITLDRLQAKKDLRATKP